MSKQMSLVEVLTQLIAKQSADLLLVKEGSPAYYYAQGCRDQLRSIKDLLEKQAVESWNRRASQEQKVDMSSHKFDTSKYIVLNGSVKRNSETGRLEKKVDGHTALELMGDERDE